MKKTSLPAGPKNQCPEGALKKRPTLGKESAIFTKSEKRATLKAEKVQIAEGDLD